MHPVESRPDPGAVAEAHHHPGGLAFLRDWPDPDGVPDQQHGEDVFSYCDAAGGLAYEVVRSRTSDGQLAVLIRSPDGRAAPAFDDLGDVEPIPYRLPELLAADPSRLVLFVEREWDADRAIIEGLIATCAPGGLVGLHSWTRFATHLGNRHVVVVTSGDEIWGRADEVARHLAPYAASVRLVRLGDEPAGGGLADYLDGGHTVENLKALIRSAPRDPEAVETPVEPAPAGALDALEPARLADAIGIPVVSGPSEGGLPGLPGFLGSPPEPRPLREELLPVPELLPEFLPGPLRPWVIDIAERMQCPVEFPAVSALVALGSVAGRQIMMRPKRHDDWAIPLNLWGAIIAPPGNLKTPATREALNPLRRLEKVAQEHHQAAMDSFRHEETLVKSKAEAAQAALKAKLKGGTDDEAMRDLAAQVVAAAQLQQPPERRYLLNDPTIEKLGEILKENPNGVLVFRDELVGWLNGLDRSGREMDRAFYLESFNGNSSFAFDRIGRGTTYIEGLCLSILGGIQPGPLGEYFSAAAKLGKGHDGLISRFQLLVYPDVRGTWVNVDRWPDHQARDRVFRVFDRLKALEVLAVGAEFDRFDNTPFLRFAPDAQDLFYAWQDDLENGKLRSFSEDPLVICHLSKYRSLMPKLALLFHLVEVIDGGTPGPVSLRAAELAAAWCDLLEAHARRIYEHSGSPANTSARYLAARIKKGEVSESFATHSVVKRGWAGLGTTTDVEAAVERLETLGWVYREKTEPGPQGGRPKTLVYLNPKLRGGGG